MNYLYNVWSAFSQLLNSLVGGVPSETVSGRAYRADNWVKKVINGLFFFEDDHCKTAHDSDVEDALWLLLQIAEEVEVEEFEEVETPSKPIVKDYEYFASLPFDKKIQYARNGVWIEKGIGDFFEQRFNPNLSDEERKEIAKAYAFRSGMPYNDPTVENKRPTGHGMGQDGHQK